jgi:hypothetical protein
VLLHVSPSVDSSCVSVHSARGNVRVEGGLEVHPIVQLRSELSRSDLRLVQTHADDDHVAYEVSTFIELQGVADAAFVGAPRRYAGVTLKISLVGRQTFALMDPNEYRVLNARH